MNKKTITIIIVAIAIIGCLMCIGIGVAIKVFSTPTQIAANQVNNENQSQPTDIIKTEIPTEITTSTNIPTEVTTPTDIPIIPTNTIENKIIPTGKIGDRIENNGIAFTILSAKKENQIQGFTPQTGNIYIIIDVKIENVSSEAEIPYNLFYFKIKDITNGYEYNPSFISAEPSLQSGNIQKGEMVRGFVTFEVKSADVEYLVIYEPLVFDGSPPIKVNLGKIP